MIFCNICVTLIIITDKYYYNILYIVYNNIPIISLPWIL